MASPRITTGPIYYVYALLDTRKPGRFKYGPWVFKFEPFYVGKGKSDRVHAHARDARKGPEHVDDLKSRKIRNILKITGKAPIHHIVKDGLLEQDAFDLERRVVQTIGRIQLQTGPLTNKSDGGEGQKNALLTTKRRKAIGMRSREWWSSLSDEQRQKMTEKLQAAWDARTDEERQAHRDHISQSLQSMSEQDKKHRRINISKSVKKFIAENPDLRADIDARVRRTKSNWTDEERARLSQRVSASHAARSAQEKAESARKMSESGKLRAATESEAVKTKRARALSKSNRAAWASYTEEEREARTKVTAAARHDKPKKELRAINAKISDSVRAAHASQTEEQRAARNAAISRTMLTKPPRDSQVYRAGCTMRARLRPVPGLYQQNKQKCKTWLAKSTTSLDGSDKSWSKWNVRCASFCDQLLTSA